MPERHTLSVSVNGRRIEVPGGISAAAAVRRAGVERFRRSVGGEWRGPLCGMGTCHECRITINGRPHQRSCLIACETGMELRTDE